MSVIVVELDLADSANRVAARIEVLKAATSTENPHTAN